MTQFFEEIPSEFTRNLRSDQTLAALRRFVDAYNDLVTERDYLRDIVKTIIRTTPVARVAVVSDKRYAKLVDSVLGATHCVHCLQTCEGERGHGKKWHRSNDATWRDGCCPVCAVME